jgi:hypothetical protein
MCDRSISKSLAILLALCGLAFAAEANRLTGQERAEGWQLLFDGSTTNGWEEITGKPFPHNCWTVEDGCLRALVRADGSQDIRTVGTFRSFDLQFDWKLTANGNSGVKYLIQRADEWVNRSGRQARARGLEYQLADERNSEASDPSRTTGALYSLIAPEPRTSAAVGTFNHSRLVVRGHHVEHWLNGVRVVEFDTVDPRVVTLLRGDLPKGSPPNAPLRQESPISLQNHTSAAWFRSIKVRRLD